MKPKTRYALRHCSAMASAALFFIGVCGFSDASVTSALGVAASKGIISAQCQCTKTACIANGQAENDISAIGISAADTPENDDDFAITHHRRFKREVFLVEGPDPIADRFRKRLHLDSRLARAPPGV